MRHEDLTKNHILERWVYANAAARTSASGFTTGDVGKLAYQSDTGQYWRLLTVAPTWAIIDASSVVQFTPGNPTGTANTGGLMMGLGTTISYTPIKTGKVTLTITGSISQPSASQGAKVNARYGTGVAPANGAALAGTPVGNQPKVTNNASTAGLIVPFALKVYITGLTLGTAYWFDLALAAITGPGVAVITDLTAVIEEV